MRDPGAGAAPSPCGGGADVEGTTGASAWISSNPPSYGVGLATPYGPGGTFSTTLTLTPMVNGGLDCRVLRCAVVTRNDHTRSADRSQDLLVPVSFAPEAPAPTPQVAGPPTTLPTATTVPPPPPTTVAPTTTTTPPAPAARLAPDGRSATDGVRTLAVSRAADLDPDGQRVLVRGEGFDPARGVYLALCRVPARGAAPGPCSSGSVERAAWVVADPPDYAEDLAVALRDDGSFEAELVLDPELDRATDCTQVACAVTVRSDDTAPDDRSLDLAVPVAFARPGAAEADEEGPGSGDGADEVAAAPVVDPTEDPSDATPSTAVVALVAVAALALGGVGAWAVRRRRAGVEGPA